MGGGRNGGANSSTPPIAGTACRCERVESTVRAGQAERGVGVAQRLAVPGCCDGAVLAQDNRLGDGAAHAGATVGRRAAARHRDSPASAKFDRPFGAGQPVRQCRTHETAEPPWTGCQNEPQGKLLGQRGDGKVLPESQDGAGMAPSLRQPRRGKARSPHCILNFYNAIRLHSSL